MIADDLDAVANGITAGRIDPAVPTHALPQSVADRRPAGCRHGQRHLSPSQGPERVGAAVNGRAETRQTGPDKFPTGAS